MVIGSLSAVCLCVFYRVCVCVCERGEDGAREREEGGENPLHSCAGDAEIAEQMLEWNCRVCSCKLTLPILHSPYQTGMQRR